jgi:hypothetical protein
MEKGRTGPVWGFGTSEVGRLWGEGVGGWI